MYLSMCVCVFLNLCSFPKYWLVSEEIEEVIVLILPFEHFIINLNCFSQSGLNNLPVPLTPHF